MREIMATFRLSNGKLLVMETEIISGMAGEPMRVTYLSVDGLTVKTEDVKDLLPIESLSYIIGYLEGNEIENNITANNWVR